MDTEGVQDHIQKARSLQLPHVVYFDKAFELNLTTPMQQLMAFVDHLMLMDDATFVSQEWRFSQWRDEAAAALPRPAEANSARAVIAGLVA